jgi:hypothetical protein
MPERRGGIVGKLIAEVETRSGVTMVDNDRLSLLEQGYTDLRTTQRELDLLGYTALDFVTGNPKEMRPDARRTMAQKVLVAWMYDPQLARAISMLNDFTFGRGIPQPRAKDKAVQEILDDFWDDRDNKILISSHEGQVAMGTDLSIQSNLFPLIFDDGNDGKIKVGLLNHDSVEDVVRDENNRLRIMYYAAREVKQKYDYTLGRYVSTVALAARPELKYYEHWANVQSAEEDGDDFEKPPAGKMGDGKVYHLVVNRTTEMAFGVPEQQRVLRWAASYNDFMAARVDMMKAAAAFIMKRQIKGTPNQLAKMATRAISRSSPLTGMMDPSYPTAGRAAAILNENDLVTHSALKIDTGAQQAAADADMLHGQIAAGTGLPRHYLGTGDANLATATAMEVFVIKMVESRQEVFEGFYRALFDMVIQKALDDGLLDENADPEDLESTIDDANIMSAVYSLEAEGLIEESDRQRTFAALRLKLVQGIEDEAQQERDTQRDLTYEFSMPNPLRRMMTDLVTAVQGIAQTFDPNNTNTELNRVLLAIVLGEALEIDDPAGVVEKVFPEGYVDPMIALAQQQQEQGAQGDQGAATGGGNIFGGNPRGPSVVKTGATSGDAGGNSYGAKMTAPPAEQQPGMQQGRVSVVKGRNGKVVLELIEAPRAARPDEDEALVTQVRGRSVGIDELFENEVGRVAMEELRALTVGGSSNGDHNEGDD